MTKPEPPQRSRLILLGASNLTRGFPTVVSTARSLLKSPLDVVACLGHGRSYGMWSTVMGRSLPGILECGIWKALDPSLTTSPHRHITTSPATFALITDIGNDVMYGATPEQISQWVEQCIDRLESHGASVVINPPPVESIRSVKRWQYAVVKSLLFPTRRLTFDTAIGRALELHDRIIDLAKRRNLAMISSEPQWYGFDPIHIRRTHWPVAWGKIISGCVGRNNERLRGNGMTVREHLHLITRKPESWRMLSISRSRAQPSGALTDGSTISLY